MTTLSELRELMARATMNDLSWEDDSRDGRFIATLYSGRGPHKITLPNQDDFYMHSHGMNLFGRMDPDANGRNNLDFLCAAINALPQLLLIAEKAQAVVDRWDTPLWKDVPATQVFIEELRQAIAPLTTNERK